MPRKLYYNGDVEFSDARWQCVISPGAFQTIRIDVVASGSISLLRKSVVFNTMLLLVLLRASGLGPGPGWGPYGPLWVLLDRSWQVRTCSNHDFWLNFARVGFKICFLRKFLNDSAWFCLEKLKNMLFLTKTLIFDPKSQKHQNDQNNN